MALGALEILSVAVFTADYAARVVSAAAAEEGGGGDGSCCNDGAMRYVVSFYGVVDLLSVLPFFLGLPVCGGLRDLSPRLLPTVVSRQERCCVRREIFERLFCWLCEFFESDESFSFFFFFFVSL